MKRNITIIAGLLLIPALSFSQIWNQVGADIDGEAASDGSGTSVSISADGTIVAIGANNNGGGAGHTRVYQFSGTWNQLGADIDGSGFAWSDQLLPLSTARPRLGTPCWKEERGSGRLPLPYGPSVCY